MNLALKDDTMLSESHAHRAGDDKDSSQRIYSAGTTVRVELWHRIPGIYMHFVVVNSLLNHNQIKGPSSRPELRIAPGLKPLGN
jgi:hypothetical protein